MRNIFSQTSVNLPDYTPGMTEELLLSADPNTVTDSEINEVEIVLPDTQTQPCPAKSHHENVRQSSIINLKIPPMCRALTCL